MKLSKLSFAVIAASCVMAGAAQAEVKTSGAVAFTTDYKFRGVSQTSNNAAVQGSMTLTHDTGLYFTAWGSSIANPNGGLELDTLFGYSAAKGDITYDVGVMRYNYPGNDSAARATALVGGATPSNRLSYNEAYASVSAYGAKLGGAISDDYFGDSGKFHYLYADYAREIAQGFGVIAHVGYNHFDSAAAMRKALATGATGEKTYLDYKLGVTKSVNGIGFELSYTGTDFQTDDFIAGGTQSRVAKPSAVLSATKTF